MAAYRLYFINRSSGRFEGRIDFEAPDDALAAAIAREHEGTQSFELWTGARKVCRVEGLAPAMGAGARDPPWSVEEMVAKINAMSRLRGRADLTNPENQAGSLPARAKCLTMTVAITDSEIDAR